MSGIEALFYREAKIRITNLMWMFWDVFYPLGYLLVFGVGVSYTMGAPFAVEEMNYNAFFLAGVLVMASFGIASNFAYGFFVDRDNGIFYEMLTYPLSRAEFLAGKVLFNVLLAFVQAAVTVGLAWLLLGVPLAGHRLPMLLLGVVGGSAGWFFFYTIFALRIRRNDLFNTVTSVFYFVFLFASSIFYPLEPLPRWFRNAALANPVTWHADFLRYGTIGQGDPARVWTEAAAFGVFSVVSFVLAVRSLQRE